MNASISTGHVHRFGSVAGLPSMRMCRCGEVLKLLQPLENPVVTGLRERIET